MTQADRSLGALIGSRICHDLISPVGAISNGLELMSFTGAAELPEMTLVADSAAHANARLRFFRIAFGLSRGDQIMADSEIRSVLAGVYTAKIACIWQVDGPLSRKMAQAAFLALLCVEQTVPFGGTITVRGNQNRLELAATGERLAPAPEYWALLNGTEQPNLDDLPAAQVQFALLPGLLANLDRSAAINLEGCVSLSF